MKIKVIAWLLFRDRLNTHDMLDRRHCAKEDDDLTCVLCNGGHRETRLHLFFTCSFSVRCWQHLGIVLNPNVDFFPNGGLGTVAIWSERFPRNLLPGVMAYLEAKEWAYILEYSDILSLLVDTFQERNSSAYVQNESPAQAISF